MRTPGPTPPQRTLCHAEATGARARGRRSRDPSSSPVDWPHFPTPSAWRGWWWRRSPCSCPALVHGASLGPFDQLSRYGLSANPRTVVHYTGPGDQIEMLIPWTTLAWTQVHHGHLPLWNPYSGLGMPLVFNWQSASFSVPALRRVPVPRAPRLHRGPGRDVADRRGSGSIVLGRVLRLGRPGCRHGRHGLRAERPLHGLAGMAERGGHVVGGLAVRGGHSHRPRPAPVPRHRAVRGLSRLCRLRRANPRPWSSSGWPWPSSRWSSWSCGRRRTPGPIPVLRPVVDLALATVAGAALSAPLALPGLQLASTSVVRVVSSYGALPGPRSAQPALPGVRRPPRGGQPMVRQFDLPRDRRVRRGHRAVPRRRGGGNPSTPARGPRLGGHRRRHGVRSPISRPSSPPSTR